MKNETKDMIKGIRIIAKKLVLNYGDVALMVLGCLIGDDIVNMLGGHPKKGFTDYQTKSAVVNGITYILPMAYGIGHSFISVYKNSRDESYTKINSAIAGIEAAGFRFLRNHMVYTFGTSTYSEPNTLQVVAGTGIPDGLRYARPISRATQGIESLIKKHNQKKQEEG